MANGTDTRVNSGLIDAINKNKAAYTVVHYLQFHRHVVLGRGRVAGGHSHIEEVAQVATDSVPSGSTKSGPMMDEAVADVVQYQLEVAGQ